MTGPRNVGSEYTGKHRRDDGRGLAGWSPWSARADSYGVPVPDGRPAPGAVPVPMAVPVPVARPGPGSRPEPGFRPEAGR